MTKRYSLPGYKVCRTRLRLLLFISPNEAMVLGVQSSAIVSVTLGFGMSQVLLATLEREWLLMRRNRCCCAFPLVDRLSVACVKVSFALLLMRGGSACVLIGHAESTARGTA